ncbi:hypothetical protein HID58_020426 [Brassica napus]|uniref:Uncharacterized protein n=1 Tax=Brassica napus TaxID=3708 RepID=A0ABQ7XH19_BRANA|nr:hypothetical protein HID58_020426 [Brassica napus]
MSKPQFASLTESAFYNSAQASRKKKKTPSSNLSPPRVKKAKPRKKDGGFSVVTSGPNTISNIKDTYTTKVD